jgi:hypothetical protein
LKSRLVIQAAFYFLTSESFIPQETIAHATATRSYSTRQPFDASSF